MKQIVIPQGYAWAKVTDLKPGDSVHYLGRDVTVKGLVEKDEGLCLVMNDGGPDYEHRTLLSGSFLTKF
jgi:hypothetical protein